MASNYLEQLYPLIAELFAARGEGAIHGLVHGQRVMDHVSRAFEFDNKLVHVDMLMDDKLAALLHDVDDNKIFPDSRECENARQLLKTINYPAERIDKVCHMISLVSFSKNGIKPVPKWWMGVARDADRLEALGWIGVMRCICYGFEIGRPLFDADTPRLQSTNAIWAVSVARTHGLTSGRRHYTSLDYFLSGLVHRCIMSSGLKYFELKAAERLQPIIDTLLHFGQMGIVDYAFLETHIDDDVARDLLFAYRHHFI